MEIFYPVDTLEVLRQMMAFYCWACAACWGWRFADFFLARICELIQVLRRKKEP